MNWNNSVVKLSVKSREINFNHPLNIFGSSNSTGTGFFISNKYILTCYHVVKNAINIDVYYQQTNNVSASIYKIFPDDDLAIIEIDKVFNDVIIIDFKPITTIENGDVFSVGFPLQSTNIKITKGIISGYQGSLIQTDASLNPGNSGGPLVILDEIDNKYKIIGVNVSKLKGNVERVGFVVPIYRFLILINLINDLDMIIKKPILNFDYQKITQQQLRDKIFKLSKYNYLKNTQIGIRITLLNSKYYFSKNIKENDIILSINKNSVDYNGKIKFDFYPEKISVSDFEIFDEITQKIRLETIKLEITKTNLIDYYYLPNYPNYFIENSGLILSIFTQQHFNNLKSLDLDITQIFRLINRQMFQQDLFTVYLSDINYSKMSKFIKYPIGEIIIEINDCTFNNYDEFINLTKQKITSIKTIENQIFFI